MSTPAKLRMVKPHSKATRKQQRDAKDAADDLIVAQALAIIERRIARPGAWLHTPTIVKDYLRMHLSTLEHEVLIVLFLDAKNRLTASEQMFRGTINTTSIHPREIVKAALKHNAFSIILAHNHPSGLEEASEADILITRKIKQALDLVEVRVLDHFIVAGTKMLSFAEYGLI
jgi:DNA repair protein RadC